MFYFVRSYILDICCANSLESEEKLNYLIDENYELREFLSEESKKSESFDTLLAQIKNEAEIAKEESQAMSTKMSEIEVFASQQVESARNQTQKAQSRVEEISSQLESARSEFETARVQNDEMKSQLASAQSVVESLKSQIEAVQSDLTKSLLSSQLFEEKVAELTRIIEEKQNLVLNLEGTLIFLSLT